MIYVKKLILLLVTVLISAAFIPYLCVVCIPALFGIEPMRLVKAYIIVAERVVKGLFPLEHREDGQNKRVMKKEYYTLLGESVLLGEDEVREDAIISLKITISRKIPVAVRLNSRFHKGYITGGTKQVLYVRMAKDLLRRLSEEDPWVGCPHRTVQYKDVAALYELMPQYWVASSGDKEILSKLLEVGLSEDEVPRGSSRGTVIDR